MRQGRRSLLDAIRETPDPPEALVQVVENVVRERKGTVRDRAAKLLRGLEKRR